jgi:hypothetical protein
MQSETSIQSLKLKIESCNSYEEFRTIINEWESENCVQLSTGSSHKLKEEDVNETIRQKFIYKDFKFKCIHGGKSRSNKKDNSRPMQKTNKSLLA